MKRTLISLAAVALLSTAAHAYETPLGPQPDFTLPGAAVYPAKTPADAIARDNLVKASIANPRDNYRADHICLVIRTDTGACVTELERNGGGGDGGH